MALGKIQWPSVRKWPSARDSGPRRDIVALSEKVALGVRQWPPMRDSGPL